MEPQYSKKNRLITLYFKAWKIHDIDLIREIFCCKANYKILGNNHKIYHGLEEIIRYWIRNKKRQIDVKIRYRILSLSITYGNVVFESNFYDKEEDQFQIISGRIHFEFYKGKIAVLSEKYKKSILDPTKNQIKLGKSRSYGKKFYNSYV